VHEGRVVLGVVEVRGPSVVLGDVGRGGDRGEERVDQLDAPGHVGLGEDGAQPVRPSRQFPGLGEVDGVRRSVVVGRQYLVEGARRRGSSALLGGAFGVCAAPCIGPVLASILALASESRTVVQGSLLLLVYSGGLAVPFVLVGVGFTRVLGAFRWLRDRYREVRVVSGALLVAVGLLLFFDRFWWLNIAVNRVFDFVGIGV
jgi:hypothetical protein